MATGDASGLYGLPLGQFVPSRAVLVKDLRAHGRREEAQRVGALRKPSVAAWVVNQLARTQAQPMAALFAAGDELERAHAELLAGSGSADALRSATARERELVERLTLTASGLLAEDGGPPSPTTIERVSETLHAAALEAHARQAVRAGCLERELRHVGLGSAPTAAQAAVDRAPRRRAPTTTPEDADSARAARERREQLASARRTEARTRGHAEQTARALDAAHRHRDQAAEELRAADARVISASTAADAADAAHRAAEQALTDAERRVRQP